MLNEAVAAAPRPRRSTISSLASTFLAKELAGRIPEYASYVETDGLEALAHHVREAVKGYHPSSIDFDTAARQIELATMVGAPARTKALLMGFEKHHAEASVLLEGGWIRESGIAAPFEGNFARVALASDGRAPRVGYAFRHPDLDVRGVFMFVDAKMGAVAGGRGELVHYEKVWGVEPVKECDLEQVEARHRWLTRLAEQNVATGTEKLGHLEKAFAQAEFVEMAPFDRGQILKSMADELNRALLVGDEGRLKNVLTRFAGVAAAVAAIPDSADLVDGAPELRQLPAPRV
ncbi:hypothetical protein PQI07_26270 [Methylobacterium sp. 092160098-2]|uniref:hypothetical protein n=1 Tax=Methylobacterium sp. 092160098-2 TaxID=3025129 RepID=UPI0023819FA7|nr:hypothetical protein [Methylobacterium sp. 092160098-2]MDE4914179.1 hypothetical protein [Methylobacterium sp. 092160098-2]